MWRTSTVARLFEWLRDASHPRFRDVQKLLKLRELLGFCRNAEPVPR